MASEDVIELGSSDDEAEPAPKKSKPMPNAMVCIPRKIHEVTIRPSKLNSAKAVPTAKGLPTVKGLSTAKGLPTARGVFTSKEITIVKKGVPLAKKRTTVSKPPVIICNPFASKTKPNGAPLQKNMRPHIKTIKPIKIQNVSTSHPNIIFAKYSEASNANSATSALLKPSVNIQNKNSLNNLPSSITVKKTTQSSSKPIIFMKPANQILEKAINSKQVNEVQTVDLDDDEGSPTTSGPAWYLRPEEQTEIPTLEQENNAEPERPAMIEITIEDSPIKPVLNKRTCEIGAEFAITIDDSPVKATADKNACPSGSDEETTTTKAPNSKKKLEYPKGAEKENKKTLEIEIDIPFEDSSKSVDSREKDTGKETIDDFSEVSFVNIQAPEPNKKHDAAEKSNQNTNVTTSKENKMETPSSSDLREFHSVYQGFINACFELENSEDMKKIVEKKIKGYYRQVPKDYTESEEFVDMVASKILAMKANPEKMYLYIKDIVDELNMQRKIAKSQIENMETKTEEPQQYAFRDKSEYDSKRQRQIRKLEKTIKKLHRAIQKLEEQEVDFDDEDDSVYLLTERYKERMVRVYAKFCQLTNTKMPSEPRIILEARPGYPSGPAKRLEKWINKKVPIGTPLPFPDFHDVLRCVRDANDVDKLGWNEAEIMEEARDLFTRCGKKLQRRRQENEWRLAVSRIAVDVDPAENNEQLKCKLEENKKVAANKETEIFNRFADRQNQLKLEAVEIADSETEESPVESEEEEESVLLQNKAKRKERLKRLLNEISKGPSEGKENQLSKEPEVKEKEFKVTEFKETKVTETEVKQPEVKEIEAVETSKESEANNEIISMEKSDAKENKDNNSDKNLETSENNDKDYFNAAETLSVSSDDSNDLESDVDELHLLQKLHSGNEAESSTLESSDSESPIAISDSIESGSDSETSRPGDVISIENSSYSESEVDKNDSIAVKNTESDKLIPDNQPKNESKAVVEMETDSNVIETSPTNNVMDLECINANAEKANIKSNNNECSELVENILLASSDDETVESQEDGPSSAEGASINLRDDLISIDETVVGNVAEEPEKNVKSDSSVSEKVSNDDELSVIKQNTNDSHIKDDNKDTEKSKICESISVDSSQEIAPGASGEEAAKNIVSVETEVTEFSDKVTEMDVDKADKESEKVSTLEDNNLPSASS